MSCRCSSSFKKTLAWCQRLMACRCSLSFKKTLATVLLFILLLFLLDSPGPDGNPSSRKGRTLRQVFEERRSRMEKYCNSHNETRFWIVFNFQPTLIYFSFQHSVPLTNFNQLSSTDSHNETRFWIYFDFQHSVPLTSRPPTPPLRELLPPKKPNFHILENLRRPILLCAPKKVRPHSLKKEQLASFVHFRLAP